MHYVTMTQDHVPYMSKHGNDRQLHLNDGLPTTLRASLHRRQRRRERTVCSPQKTYRKEETCSLLSLLDRPYVRFVLCSAARTLQGFLDYVLRPSTEPEQPGEASISLYVTIWR